VDLSAFIDRNGIEFTSFFESTNLDIDIS